MSVMKRIGILILSLSLILLSVPRMGMGQETPVFHGFSSDSELIMSIDSELFWLTPEDDVPTFTIPATHVFYHPGANYIYFMLDTQIWKIDFDHQEMSLVEISSNELISTQAEKNILLLNDINGSHIFLDGNHIVSRSSLLAIDSFKSDKCLLMKDGDGGAIVIDTKTGEILGECDNGTSFSFLENGIVSVSDDNSEAFLCAMDFSIKTILPRNGVYYLQEGNLYQRCNGNEYIIDPDNPTGVHELPRFKHTFICDTLFLGITDEGEYNALELPTLELKANNLSFENSSEWVWFKSYSNRIIANIDNQGAIINKDSGVLTFTECKPVSSSEELVLCSSRGKHCILNTDTNTSVSIDLDVDAENISILSHTATECNILVSTDSKKQILRIDVANGEILDTQNVYHNVFVAGMPRSKTLSDSTNSYDAGSIQKLRKGDYSHATALFFSLSDVKTIFVYQPDNVTPIIYSSPVDLR